MNAPFSSIDPVVQDYLAPVLRVLSDGQSRTSKQLREEVYDLMGLTKEQRASTHEKSGQRRVDVRANFAVSHLRRAEALEGGYGEARITEVGRHLLAEHPDGLTFQDLDGIPAYRDYVPQREATQDTVDEGGEGQSSGADDDAITWFVGAAYEDLETGDYTDYSGEFVRTGQWRVHPESRPSVLRRVREEMRPGDRIAIKAAYGQKYDLPFETNGHKVSVMDIKATGMITANPGDGEHVEVRWEQDHTQEPLHWYFFTYQRSIWRIDPTEDASRRALVDFAFKGVPQDIDSFRNAPYWADRFGDDAVPAQDENDEDGTEDLADVVVEVDADDDAPAYTTEGIIADGGFLEKDELEAILRTWRQKKNLILQGPPGTGKTWLAKRLARVLVGTADEDLITSVQFHPTVSYEDFVRGWRPAGDGPLTLVDGVLLQIAQRAAAEPDRTHVLVIEEINRGNLAQIFGEMLTLLEADKRTAEQAMRLAYMRPGEKPFHLPENLYVVGTMNLADRSLAMVDFALRRRFGFADLTPQFELPWVTWVGERVDGADEADVQRLGGAVKALNAQIVAAPGLGEQYQIGHSFLTPGRSERGLEFRPWAESVIRQEIRPLLTEYWFDQPAQVDAAVADLLAALPAAP